MHSDTGRKLPEKLNGIAKEVKAAKQLSNVKAKEHNNKRNQ